MRNKFKEQLLNNKDEVIQLWTDELVAFNDEEYDGILSNELFGQTNKEFAEVIYKNIKGEGSIRDFQIFTEKLINLGWPLTYVTDGLQSFRRVAINFFLQQFEIKDSRQVSEILNSVEYWVAPIIQNIVSEYTISWEEIVSLQRLALQELSAPLIPVMDNITVMPLIGTIDTGRARLIMENLLAGVIKHSAEVVLIDITGVPVVDTMVAHHIIQAAEAVRLIGSNCILVGIRPEIAQTIVSLGIDLNRYPTQNSLKKGFEEALKLTHREIIRHSTKDSTLDNMINSIGKE